MAAREDKGLVLAGLDHHLPSTSLCFEGDGYWIYTSEQPRSTLHEHTHDDCVQVSVGLDARARLEWQTTSPVRERREWVGTGVAVIPPGVPHSALWLRRGVLVTIYISKRFLSTTAGQVVPETRVDLEPMRVVRDPLIEELGRALYREWFVRELTRPFANSVATVLVTHLLRNYRTSAEVSSGPGCGLGPARTRRVCKYIEQSLECDLSIGALAKVAGLSPNYFAVMFRQATGFTPHQYVCQRRVDMAQRLLTDGDLPLVDVAYRCGFASQSQFTTVFLRVTGVTPGRFRSENATFRQNIPSGRPLSEARKASRS